MKCFCKLAGFKVYILLKGLAYYLLPSNILSSIKAVDNKLLPGYLAKFTSKTQSLPRSITVETTSNRVDLEGSNLSYN